MEQSKGKERIGSLSVVHFCILSCAWYRNRLERACHRSAPSYLDPDCQCPITDILYTELRKRPIALFYAPEANPRTKREPLRTMVLPCSGPREYGPFSDNLCIMQETPHDLIFAGFFVGMRGLVLLAMVVAVDPGSLREVVVPAVAGFVGAIGRRFLPWSISSLSSSRPAIPATESTRLGTAGDAHLLLPQS